MCPEHAPLGPEGQPHLARFYGSEEEYTQGVLRFAAPAIEAHEPVAVAVPGSKAGLLEERLRQAGSDPEIFDMVQLGRHPARIIPAVEALINLAWPGTAIRVPYPYGQQSLAPAVLEGAQRTQDG
jgi:hypothetical protein